MLTIGELVAHNEQIWSEVSAYKDAYRSVTWREFGRRTDAIGRGLRRAGVMPGDRVATLSVDRIEVAEIFVACLKIGAVRVGYNHRLASAEIAQLIDDSEPTVLAFDLSVATAAAAAVAESRHSPMMIEFGGAGWVSTSLEQLIANNWTETPIQQDPNDLAMICYTTGSTGLPKGALYSHDAILASMMRIALCEGATHDDVWLHTMPAGGVPLLHMCRNIFHASTMIILGPWDPERAYDIMSREGVTRGVFVPTMLTGLIEAARKPHSGLAPQLRCFEYGSSPLPPAVIREAAELLSCPFLQMYGTTELTGMAAMLYPSDHERGLTDRPEILASIGRPLPYVKVRVVDDSGNDVEPGEMGELIVKTDLITKGYWRAEEKYQETVRGGWLLTGDYARQDALGYVYLGDRKSFRIKSGGYNVYPIEIENVLAEYPGVREVCVVGVPDARWGEHVHAVVVAWPDAHLTAEDLKAFCALRVGKFKVPKTIDFWTELPRGATGKILKREVRERSSQEHGS